MAESIGTNKAFDNLLDFLQGHEISENPAEGSVYKEFINAFPLETLPNLTLDQYCLGKSQKSFCWWLERGLVDVLGRYSPGTSRGHIMYFKNDGSLYKNRHLTSLSDEDALRYTLKIQSVYAKADPSNDLSWLDDDAAVYKAAGVEPLITVGEGRKLRLISAYHPGHMLPISSSAHAGHFLEVLGCPKDRVPKLAQAIARSQLLWRYYEKAKERFAALTPYSFMMALYSPVLNIAPQKDISDVDDRAYEGELMFVNLDGSNMRPPLNQILYGPPGTGKTYSTVNAALRILAPEYLKIHQSDRKTLKAKFDEYVASGNIKFVTFHQSFSYEDFVEGLKAETDEDGQIRYEVVDGIFKTLCDLANARVTQHKAVGANLDDRRIWKMSLGNTLGSDAYIYDECIKNGYALIGFGGGVDFSGCQSREEVYERFRDSGLSEDETSYAVTAITNFVVKMKIGDLLVVSEGNNKFRAIGEIGGDYRNIKHEDDYSQCRSVNWLRVYEPALPREQLMHNKFSQMTLYELRQPSIDKGKLAALLDQEVLLGQKHKFMKGESFGRGYEVRGATQEILELSKPNGNSLPIPMALLETLATLVRSGKVTIEDIREKKVFDKVLDSNLEPFLVNGYNNILAVLVERLVEQGSTSSAAHEPFPHERVLIIDEINRGNVSRIFGELITLIEGSKRLGQPEALEVTLPYSKEKFSVPSNLFIVGTMNTADRSLAGLDIALRRRFVFIETPPLPDLLDDVEIDGIKVGKLLRVINSRIELLLDKDHCIGHAYFMELKNSSSLQDLASVFRQKIIPLLEEYFFDDWQRIQWILNDHRKPQGFRFIDKPDANVEELFGSDVPINERSQRWAINEAAFGVAEAYLGTIKS